MKVSEVYINRITALEDALFVLVNMYVANIGDTDNEFITCITPKQACKLTYFERKKCEVWSAWDNARTLLGAKYIL